MLSPHDQLVCARQILSAEYFPPTEENLAIEKALESLGAFAPFRVISFTLRKRIPSDRGLVLLNDLRWLLDGDAYTRSPDSALHELVEALGRSVQDSESGVREFLHRRKAGVSVAAG